MTEGLRLYKKDTKGKIRVWSMEIEDDKYRTISGLIDGALVESKWKVAKPKNVGRSNATTGHEQAVKEVQSLYEGQLDEGGYWESIEDVDNEGLFKPMLATRYDHVDNIDFSGRVFAQPKLDGIRCNSTNQKMQSRNGKAIVSSPHIYEAVKDTLVRELDGAGRDLILDGELYNHALNENFNKLQSLIMRQKPAPEDLVETRAKVQHHLYDIVDKNRPNLKFSERLALLEEFVWGLGEQDFIVLVPTVEVFNYDDIDRVNAEFIEMGYEGAIYRLDAPYENKRTKVLIKRKEFFDAEYPISDIEEGDGNWASCAKSIVFYKGTPKEFRAGIRGTQEEMALLLKEKDKNIGSDATVRYPNLTPDGKPRFGVVVLIHDGKRIT